MISEDLRRSYRQRAQALETSVRHLIAEIQSSMDPRVLREFRKRLNPRADLLFNEIDRAIHHDVADDDLLEYSDRVQEEADHVLAAFAELEKMRRANRHELEDAEYAKRVRQRERIDQDLDRALDNKPEQ